MPIIAVRAFTASAQATGHGVTCFAFDNTQRIVNVTFASAASFNSFKTAMAPWLTEVAGPQSERNTSDHILYHQRLSQEYARQLALSAGSVDEMHSHFAFQGAPGSDQMTNLAYALCRAIKAAPYPKAAYINVKRNEISEFLETIESAHGRRLIAAPVAGRHRFEPALRLLNEAQLREWRDSEPAVNAPAASVPASAIDAPDATPAAPHRFDAAITRRDA